MPDRHDSAPRTLTKEVSCKNTYVALAKIARPLRRMPAYANQPQERKPGRGGSDMVKSLLYDERKTCNGSLAVWGVTRERNDFPFKRDVLVNSVSPRQGCEPC